MRRSFLSLISATGALFTISCSEQDPVAPCTGACALAEVTIRTTITDLDERKLTKLIHPGDSIIVTTILENPTDTVLRTGNLLVWTNPGDPRDFRYHAIPDLVAGSSLEFVDTFPIPRFTFTDTVLVRARFDPGQLSTRPLNVRDIGQRKIAVHSSGYTYEIVAMPNMMADGTVRMRQFERQGVLLRVHNPFSLPVDSLRFHFCIQDFDACFASEESGEVPRIAPGGEAYFEFTFDVDSEGYWNFWEGGETGMRICGYSLLFNDRCTFNRLELLVNFEGACDVQPIVVGVTMHDADPECPKGRTGRYYLRGSAYRFAAVAGERYRVQASSTACILPATGGSRSAPCSSEMTIPTSGTYYVVLQHNGPVDFTLTRV